MRTPCRDYKETSSVVLIFHRRILCYAINMHFLAILALLLATFSLSAAAYYEMPTPISSISSSAMTDESPCDSTTTSAHNGTHTATNAITVTYTKTETI